MLKGGEDLAVTTEKFDADSDPHGGLLHENWSRCEESGTQAVEFGGCASPDGSLAVERIMRA